MPTSIEFIVMLTDHQVDRSPLDLGCFDLMALLWVSSQLGLTLGYRFGLGLHHVSHFGEQVEGAVLT